MPIRSFKHFLFFLDLSYWESQQQPRAALDCRRCLGARQCPEKKRGGRQVSGGTPRSKVSPMALLEASVVTVGMAFDDKNEVIASLASAALLLRNATSVSRIQTRCVLLSLEGNPLRNSFNEANMPLALTMWSRQKIKHP